MTKRERRYHQQNSLHRRLQHASHILSYGVQNLIRSTQPRPKYPLGTHPERGMAMVDVSPGPEMIMDIHANLWPIEILKPPRPVSFSVDKERLSELLKEAIEKEPKPIFPTWNLKL
jgi:hypothetical protein